MRVINTYKKLRDDWYTWTVSIEGSQDELKNIDHVIYYLHPSFGSSQIVGTDPDNNFARTLEGWGEFLLKTIVILKNKEEKKAELWINLGDADTTAEKIKYDGTFK